VDLVPNCHGEGVSLFPSIPDINYSSDEDFWMILRLDIGHGLLARPGLELARPELGSARDSEGPSRAQNPGPLRAKSSPGSARACWLAIFF
jgi:hypothetical protein